jgi:predicted nucleic acid-binding protein
MTFVLDASVAVSAIRANDANHARAAAYLVPLLRGADSIVVPPVFEVELAAALARAGHPPTTVQRARTALLARARITTIGPRGSRRAADVASKTRLRGADAIYVYTAQREGLALVTLDGEILARAAAAGVTAIAP